MYTAVQATQGLDGVRLYFARTSKNGPYTIAAFATTDGGIDTVNPDGYRHIHNDIFLTVNPFAAQAGRPSDPTKPAAGASLYGSAVPCVSDACPPNIQHQHHYINCESAWGLVYSDRSGDEINSTSEWFDIGIIKALLANIKSNGGLRVYVGRHPKAIAPDTVARHGFVLIITEPDANNVQVDQFKCITITPHYPDHEEFHTGGGADNGEQCPYACTGVTWP
jgi:hypothetical protein